MTEDYREFIDRDLGPSISMPMEQYEADISRAKATGFLYSIAAVVLAVVIVFVIKSAGLL